MEKVSDDYINDGEYKSYDKNGVYQSFKRGVLIRETNYKEDFLDGESRQFFDTGELQSLSIYHEDRVIENQHYTKDGQMILKRWFNNGACYKVESYKVKIEGSLLYYDIRIDDIDENMIRVF